MAECQLVSWYYYIGRSSSLELGVRQKPGDVGLGPHGGYGRQTAQ